MKMSKNTRLFCAAAFVLLLAAAGCTHRNKTPGPGRNAVSGTVTFDGKPLPLGSITFISLKDPQQMTTAFIEKGHFSIGNAPEGECRVTVETESAHSMPKFYQPIPLKYRDPRASELKANILKDQPDGTKLTFELKSK
jgi:hypothetical protein